MIGRVLMTLLMSTLVACPQRVSTNPTLEPDTNVTSWCLPIEAIVDDVVQPWLVCAPTLKLCEKARESAIKYGKFGKVHSVGDCIEEF